MHLWELVTVLPGASLDARLCEHFLTGRSMGGRKIYLSNT